MYFKRRKHVKLTKHSPGLAIFTIKYNVAKFANILNVNNPTPTIKRDQVCSNVKNIFKKSNFMQVAVNIRNC